MKTGTSSLMDGKDYQQRKVMRIDDVNAMAVADITKNEHVEKLAEKVYLEHENNNLLYGESLELRLAYKAGIVDGYNKAKETLYTEEQVTEAMLRVCEYLIDAMESRYIIDTEQQAKIIIQSLKQK
jgi:hypothetical protein